MEQNLQNEIRAKLLLSLKETFLQTKIYFVLFLLILLLIVSFLVIKQKYDYRLVMIQQQQAYDKNDILNSEWTRLLLEYSTLASPAIVEATANNDLNMEFPDKLKTIVLKEYESK